MKVDLMLELTNNIEDVDLIKNIIKKYNNLKDRDIRIIINKLKDENFDKGIVNFLLKFDNKKVKGNVAITICQIIDLLVDSKHEITDNLIDFINTFVDRGFTKLSSYFEIFETYGYNEKIIESLKNYILNNNVNFSEMSFYFRKLIGYNFNADIDYILSLSYDKHSKNLLIDLFNGENITKYDIDNIIWISEYFSISISEAIEIYKENFLGLGEKSDSFDQVKNIMDKYSIILKNESREAIIKFLNLIITRKYDISKIDDEDIFKLRTLDQISKLYRRSQPLQEADPKFTVTFSNKIVNKYTYEEQIELISLYAHFNYNKQIRKLICNLNVLETLDIERHKALITVLGTYISRYSDENLQKIYEYITAEIVLSEISTLSVLDIFDYLDNDIKRLSEHNFDDGARRILLDIEKKYVDVLLDYYKRAHYSKEALDVILHAMGFELTIEELDKIIEEQQKPVNKKFDKILDSITSREELNEFLKSLNQDTNVTNKSQFSVYEYKSNQCKEEN